MENEARGAEDSPDNRNGQLNEQEIRMKENIPDTGFRLMGLVMRFMEWVHPQAENRANMFGIKEGMTVVDYGCGPGRYT